MSFMASPSAALTELIEFDTSELRPFDIIVTSSSLQPYSVTFEVSITVFYICI